jgi:uncharacterized protein (DUF427 family)
VSLTTGRGPLSRHPAGHFDQPVPTGLTYVEPHLRRVRARAGGQVAIDTEDVLLVHRPGHPPAYAIATADVERSGLVSEPEPSAKGYVRVPWDAAEEWWEEDEQVFMHPRNPYHRVDCIATSRRLRVTCAGSTLVDTTETVVVYETALAAVLYVAPSQVAPGILVASSTTTYCPYKGTATYWSTVVGGTTVDDVAWSYKDPYPESTAIGGLLAFNAGSADVWTDLPA